MKFSCNKKDLQNAISTVIKAVSVKTTMPILKCILFESIGDNRLKLIGNDNEIGIETVIDAEIHEMGSVAMEAKFIFDIIRSLPEETLEISVDNNLVAMIKCGNSNFRISCYDAEDFVYLPDIAKNDTVKLSQEMLKNAISQTIFSIGMGSKNKIMSGELFNIVDDKLIISALDGHRIAQRTIAIENDSNIEKKMIVPGKSLMELSRIIESEKDKSLDIYFDARHILFEFNNTKVVSRLIEGEYFDIDKMFRTGTDISLKVNKKALHDCIDRAVLMVRENERKPVVLEISDNNMNLSIKSQLGTMNEKIDIEKSGNDITLGVNPRFLMDVMKSIDDEEISIFMSGSKAPIIIKDENISYIYLILPINIA